MSETVALVDNSAFTSLGLDSRLTTTLGYDTPTPIQQAAIPVVLQGKDLIGLAGTGTGKTAAFSLPLLHRLGEGTIPRNGVTTLVLTPTRELAIQTARAIKTYGTPFNIEVIAIYGGTGYTDQIRAIRRGVEVVVATPGRALDLIRKGKFPLNTVSAVVLDEADEMLNMGFAEDIDAILSETPKERQTLLFSATMPPWIEEIAKRHQREPVRIQVAAAKLATGEAAKVRQTAYLVQRHHKLAALGRILAIEQPTSAIIFCGTRTEADELTSTLGQRGFRPLALHGGLSQENRDGVMKRFRAGAADLLVATDIAARGLDISQLSHVINYDVPQQADAYVHRIGRVGRAGRVGVAITLGAPNEQWKLRQIERVVKQRIDVSPVPTLKDVENARLDRTRQQLRDMLAQNEPTSDWHTLVQELSSEFDVKDIAVAALKLLTESKHAEEEQEIPTMTRESRMPERPSHGQVQDRQDRPRRNEPDERKRAGARPTRQGMSKVFFGIGRDANVLPRDLVGAIANETGIPGHDIGAIDLTDRFALVEVPSEVADYVVDVMQKTRIKGRRVNVRADRPPLRKIEPTGTLAE